MSTMTEEPETETTEAPIILKKWTSTAGPIQTGKVNKLFGKIRWEQGAMIELNGIREKPETHERHGFVVMFGGSRRDVQKAQFDLGEMFDWTITRENYQDIIDAGASMLEVIKANTPVKDCLKSIAEIAERDQKNAEYDAKRKEQEAKKNAEKETYIAALRNKYPWAVAGSTSANIKRELVEAFPHCSFSVTSPRHSSINIKWELGPSGKQVDEITGKYSNIAGVRVDDSVDYDHTAYGEAVQAVLGRASYISASRDIPESLREQIHRDLCEVEGVAYTGYTSKLVNGSNDDVRDFAYRLLNLTSFPAGATYAGVERAETSDPYVHWKINFVQGEVSPVLRVEQPGNQTGIHWRRNAALGGIEIVFPQGKPTEEQRSQMKGYRFQWKKGSNYWWARHDASREAFAKSFCGE